MMLRRHALLLVGGSVVALPTLAPAQALPVVGALAAITVNPPVWAGFVRGLTDMGLVEGRNYTMLARSADGHYDRLPDLARDMIAQKVSVIAALGGDGPALAARAETSSIPIVFLTAADPIKSGLVKSLSRPEGNITGISMVASELQAKRVELVDRIVPKGIVVGVLVNPGYPAVERQLTDFRQTATRLGRALEIIDATNDASVVTAFERFAEMRVGAVIIGSDPYFSIAGKLFAAEGLRHRLPVVGDRRSLAEAGCALSYGPNFADGYHAAGLYVARILKGARPSDLPVQEPTKYELIINQKIVPSIGLNLPPDILAQADEVIES